MTTEKEQKQAFKASMKRQAEIKAENCMYPPLPEPFIALQENYWYLGIPPEEAENKGSIPVFTATQMHAYYEQGWLDGCKHAAWIAGQDGKS